MLKLNAFHQNINLKFYNKYNVNKFVCLWTILHLPSVIFLKCTNLAGNRLINVVEVAIAPGSLSRAWTFYQELYRQKWKGSILIFELIIKKCFWKLSFLYIYCVFSNKYDIKALLKFEGNIGEGWVTSSLSSFMRLTFSYTRKNICNLIG